MMSGGGPGSGIVRSGTVGFKEDAFASWLWREKYLILREQTLAVHKNEVSFSSFCLFCEGLLVCGCVDPYREGST